MSSSLAHVDFIQKLGSSRHGLKSSAEDLQTVPTTLVGAVGSFAEGEIHEKLKSSPVLGLWGMGGIGKTTLSKVAFNYLHHLFEYTVFVENIKLLPGQQEDVEKAVLEKVHYRGRKMSKDTAILKQLRGESLLVVLDDVEEERDIAVVSKLREISSANSRFLLTSTHKHILALVDDMEIVDIGVLDDASSETLFRSYAILPCNRALVKWQQDCMGKIVQGCGGLPLVLEVLGKYLKGTDSREVWEQVGIFLVEIENGQSTGMDKVWAKLKVSYNSLECNVQKVFRDAATFFQGYYQDVFSKSVVQWTFRDAMAAWRAKYKMADIYWRILVDRALVYHAPTEDSPIKLHEHFRTLGKSLAEGMGEYKRVGVSNYDDGYVDDLLTKTELEKVHTLELVRKMEPPSCEIMELPSRLNFMFQKMEQLQYLQLQNCTLEVGEVILPPKLLVFVDACDINNLSFDASTSLVILSLMDCGENLLPHAFCNLVNLYSLQLRSSTWECLSESFGNLGSLQQLTLCCKRLKRLPDSFMSLRSLQNLKLDSEGLERLPDSFGSLGSLEDLTLFCKRLERLPNSFGSFGSLEKLTLYCERLERLPDSFGSLRSLQHLTLQSEKLEMLPDSFGSLESLQHLKLKNEKLKMLPDSFGSLGCLQQLTLESERLERLPDSFGSLGNLEELTLDSERLERLTDSFGNLGSLQKLELESKRLERLPNSFGSLRSLRDLTLQSEIVEMLPDSFGSLESLQHLKLKSERLEMLPDSFGSLGSLQQLTLESERLERLPDSFGSLGSLEELTLDSKRLERLPDSFGSLGSLEKLTFYCERLERLPDSFGSFGSLQHLTLQSDRLKVLPDSFWSLKSLQWLTLESERLERLPNSFGSLGSLQSLLLRSESLLELPDSFGSLRSLQQLTLQSELLERLPDSFGNLSNLQELELRYCEDLNLLPDSFTALERLDKVGICECEKLEEFMSSCPEPLKSKLHVLFD